MLKPETIAIIKSTVPVLEVHGKAITTRFYEKLFKSHPELLNLFNHGNQKQGRQQTALANAVYAAAVHIDRLHEIMPAVKVIAHKHVSLGVTPDQYPIVGENLLSAISEVLGDAATPEILGAWEEAYSVIAGAFIGVETEMTDEALHQPGGWAGFRKFTVSRKMAESGNITSFYLVPEDGGPLASFEPGQYVTVQMKIPGREHLVNRQYSLSDRPGQPYYRISVKKETGTDTREPGVASAYLHEAVQEGDTLLLSVPAGAFTLDRSADTPVVLLSAGVGLTPLTSMLRTIRAEQPARPVTFIHTAACGKLHAMKDMLQEEGVTAAAENGLRTHICYTQPADEDRSEGAFHTEGRLTAEKLKEITAEAGAKADYYICGPVSFMRDMIGYLRELGVPAESLHYEFFGPSLNL
ncbi:NO-inducible flavohemoprotein [Paenibacillus sp. UNC499MF]|uniref:NO-inducible flavohemoprotein n=1 Tax=Paenibacillus sp. UNC499MF TaxID=1502751 RepID=UPI0008A0435D|nr:NO-inducible flavohemoprotein [Paenibacillus sp. UNC499MF]SEG08339.1 nitric oxide dioxygenase [Paenibacillus sp. UNC499MF]